MNQDLRSLYTWVRRTREVLFDYTQHLPLEVYTLERPDFGFGSIRNLHAHVADCYLWWVGRVGLGQAGLELDPRLIPDTAAMRGLFAQVDQVVGEALGRFSALDQVPFPPSQPAL